jgi:transcription initiation factor TFIIH subunit 2
MCVTACCIVVCAVCRRIQERQQGNVRRGMTRHVVLALDLSTHGTAGIDKRGLFIAAASHFVSEFFHQNPLSMLSLVATRGGVAEKLSELSGTAHRHLAALGQELNLAGDPSLQNILQLAHHTLRYVLSIGSHNEQQAHTHTR